MIKGLLITSVLAAISWAFWATFKWGETSCGKINSDKKVEIIIKQRDLANRPLLPPNDLINLMLDDKL